MLKTAAPLRNEGSISLSEEDICAPWHKACHSTNEAPNFVELRLGEVHGALLSNSYVLCWRLVAIMYIRKSTARDGAKTFCRKQPHAEKSKRRNRGTEGGLEHLS